MTEWSLSKLLESLHDDVQDRLATARKVFGHATTKGDASEEVWRELFTKYLPKRYQASRAHVVDSEGTFSESIDVVVFDRQYSPFIFDFQGQIVIPAESVYAVFEAKQAIDAGEVDYAQKKVASVRRLHRTSLPIPTANGLAPAKPPHHILGGLLTFESNWNPGLGEPLKKALEDVTDEKERLDIGCVAAHGMFTCDASGCAAIIPDGKPATAFLLELIARLQSMATVPMIDVRAYARWLAK
jgi:hypothetical protein